MAPRRESRGQPIVSIYQSIEMLAKDSGIDPQIISDSVKAAMLVANRLQ